MPGFLVILSNQAGSFVGHLSCIIPLSLEILIIFLLREQVKKVEPSTEGQSG